MFVVPSGTSFHTFFRGVAAAWVGSGGEVAVAAGPDLAGHAEEWLPRYRDGIRPLFMPTSPLERSPRALRGRSAAPVSGDGWGRLTDCI